MLLMPNFLVAVGDDEIPMTEILKFIPGHTPYGFKTVGIRELTHAMTAAALTYTQYRLNGLRTFCPDLTDEEFAAFEAVYHRKYDHVPMPVLQSLSFGGSRPRVLESGHDGIEGYYTVDRHIRMWYERWKAKQSGAQISTTPQTQTTPTHLTS